MRPMAPQAWVPHLIGFHSPPPLPSAQCFPTREDERKKGYRALLALALQLMCLHILFLHDLSTCQAFCTMFHKIATASPILPTSTTLLPWYCLVPLHCQ